MDECAVWWGPESVERPCRRADLCVSESRDDAILDRAFICIPVARRTFFPCKPSSTSVEAPCPLVHINMQV